MNTTNSTPERANEKVALLQNEERLRLFIAASSSIVYRMSADWTRMEHLTGKEMLADTPEPITGWIDKYILPEDQLHVWSVIRQAISSKTIFELEHRVLQADGSVGWVHSRAIPLLNEQEEITEWFGAGSDITPRKRAEAALRESEEKYRSLFDMMEEGLTVCGAVRDADGRVIDLSYLDINQALERQTGLDRRIMLGRKLSDVFPKADVDRFMPIYAGVINSGEPVVFEEYVALLDRWYVVSAYPRRGDELSILYRDITDRKRHEQRQAYLLKLSDVLRPLADPVEIQRTALEVLRVHLGGSRTLYAEALDQEGTMRITIENREPGLVPMQELIFHFNDFTPEALAEAFTGRPLWREDVFNDRYTPEQQAGYAALGTRAWLMTPLLKAGRLVAVLTVHSSEARAWTIEDILLVQETTERTWAAVERARTEGALRDSEGRLQALIQNLPGGAAFILDRSLHYTLAGGEALASAGFTEADFIGKTPAEVIPEQAHDQLPNYQRALAGEPFTHEHEAGGLAFVTHGIPLRNAAGEVYAALAVSYDITERKRAEDELKISREWLRISEERYRTALQSANMAAWDWDAVADEVVWNDQHYLIFGLLPDGQTKNAAFFLSFVHPEDVVSVEADLREAAERTGIYHSEFRIVRRDNGEVRWMNGYGRSLMRDERGRAIRIVGVMYDITARKHLEQQKEEFMNIASHELKTPVTSMSAYAELLQDILKEEGNSDHVELMKKLNGQIHRLTGLISDLLDTTKISAGQLPLRLELVNMNELIHERVIELQRLTVNHILEIGNCPPFQVKADKERISQVLTNLISNAIKYAPRGGQVLIDCRTEDHQAIISVHDQGIGISADMLTQVFERFFRVNEVKQQNYTGLGLGLFISAGIVHRHGGKIWVESEPGKGSTFYFSLPL